MKKERGGLLARQRQIAELEVEVARLAEQMEQQNGQLDQYYAQTGQKRMRLLHCAARTKLSFGGRRNWNSS